MATGPSGYSACSPSSGRGTWPEAPGRNRQIGQRVSNRFVESARCALQVRPSVAVLLPLHDIEDIRELLAPVPKRLGLLAPHWNSIKAQPKVRRIRAALDDEPQRGSSFMAGLHSPQSFSPRYESSGRAATAAGSSSTRIIAFGS